MKTKMKNEVAKGEGDKGSDKYRKIGLLPLSAEEIPSVSVLKTCGETNLQLLLNAVNNALQSDITMCTECDGLCKATCHEKKTPTLQILEKYLVNLRVALRQTDCNIPVLPDLRTEEWLNTAQKISAYSVCDRAGERKRLERTVAIHPVCMTGKDSDGNPTTEIWFNVDDPNCPEWSACERSVFDLHSPYMLTGDEETFFIAHPDALLTWLGMCGNLYKEYVIYDDVKELFAQKISELRESQSAVAV